MCLSGLTDFGPSARQLLRWQHGGGFLQILLIGANSERVGERCQLSRLMVLGDSDLLSVIVLAMVVILLRLLLYSLTSLTSALACFVSLLTRVASLLAHLH